MKEFTIVNLKESDGKTEKYATFKDGSKSRPIFIDEDGYEYFTIPNYINGDIELEKFNCNCGYIYDKYKFTYIHRHYDALETIRNGNGDIVRCPHFFRHLNDVDVVYFLDRKHGEYLRNMFLNNTSTFTKKYVARYIGSPICITDENGKFKFDTIEEAVTCIDKYINKTLSYVQLFIGRKFDINDTKFMDEIFDIRKKENNDITLYFMILHSMNATDDGTIIYIDDDIKSFLKNSFTIEQYMEQPFYSS